LKKPFNRVSISSIRRRWSWPKLQPRKPNPLTTVPEKGIENEFYKISFATEESIILDDDVNIGEVESFTQGSVTLR